MELLVRTWNLFHGNADPPRRAGYLRRMIELVSADGPDVLCLQEVPVWALRRIDDWSGMRRFDAVTRPPLWPGPVSRWVTRAHQGVFRSGLAGQANAILVAPRHAATDLGHERISEHGRERRLVHAIRIAGHRGSDDREPPRVQRLRASRRAAGRGRHAPPRSPSVSRRPGTSSCSPGTSTSPIRASTRTRRRAAGSTTCSCAAPASGPVVAWPRERRVQNGVVLSDHPVVEARVEVGAA